MYVFVGYIKSTEEQQWVSGIINKADIIFGAF